MLDISEKFGQPVIRKYLDELIAEKELKSLIEDTHSLRKISNYFRNIPGYILEFKREYAKNERFSQLGWTLDKSSPLRFITAKRDIKEEETEIILHLNFENLNEPYEFRDRAFSSIDSKFALTKHNSVYIANYADDDKLRLETIYVPLDLATIQLFRKD